MHAAVAAVRVRRQDDVDLRIELAFDVEDRATRVVAAVESAVGVASLVNDGDDRLARLAGAVARRLH